MLDAVGTVDRIQFIQQQAFTFVYFFDESCRRLSNLLANIQYDVLAPSQRGNVRVKVVYLCLALTYETTHDVTVDNDRLTELGDLVLTVVLECTHHAHARLTRFTVVSVKMKL